VREKQRRRYELAEADDAMHQHVPCTTKTECVFMCRRRLGLACYIFIPEAVYVARVLACIYACDSVYIWVCVYVHAGGQATSWHLPQPLVKSRRPKSQRNQFESRSSFYRGSGGHETRKRLQCQPPKILSWRSSQNIFTCLKRL